MSDFIKKVGDELLCPTGRSGGGMIKIGMARVEEAEKRLQDVARVNLSTAPYLLAIFNMAYSDLQEALAKLQTEFLFATRAANKRRGQVMLDVAPRKLQEKGLTTSKNPGGSADLREAVLDQDEEYNSLLDRVDFIKAIHALLQGKSKSIEMAYTAVKRIIDRGSGTALDRKSGSVGDLADGITAGDEVDENGRMRIGTPNYK